MTLEQRLDAIQKRAEALHNNVTKFNPCHSPKTGEFCSTKGGGGAAGGGPNATAKLQAEARTANKAAAKLSDDVRETDKMFGPYSKESGKAHTNAAQAHTRAAEQWDGVNTMAVKEGHNDVAVHAKAMRKVSYGHAREHQQMADLISSKFK